MRPPLTNGQAKLDAVLGGGAIGRVEQSNHPDWSVGDYVMSRNGFREYFVSDASGLRLIELGDEPLTAHMHALGVTGFTAWGGLTITGELKEQAKTCSCPPRPEPSAASPYRSPRNRGCRVAASAGSDEKVAFLREELGADHAFNYKKTSTSQANCASACPTASTCTSRTLAVRTWTPRWGRCARSVAYPYAACDLCLQHRRRARPRACHHSRTRSTTA